MKGMTMNCDDCKHIDPNEMREYALNLLAGRKDLTRSEINKAVSCLECVADKKANEVANREKDK